MAKKSNSVLFGNFWATTSGHTAYSLR